MNENKMKINKLAILFLFYFHLFLFSNLKIYLS